MATIEKQPNNPNFLSQAGFQFNLARTPSVNFFATRATLPTIDLGYIDVNTPFVRLPNPGVNLTFGDFNLTFKVDEDMTNYFEIYDWLIQLGFPDSFTQYTAGRVSPADKNYSDGTLMVMSSKHNPNLVVTFQDMFPILLSELSFSYQDTDVESLEATVTFRYKKFAIEKL